MPADIAVRRLHERDLDDYIAIRLSALRTAPEAFGAVYRDEAARPAAHHIARLAQSLVHGAYEAGRIIGLMGLKAETGAQDAHKGLLWGVFVEPADRRRGVAARLLAATIDAARDVVEQIRLTVVTDNAPAIALYERFGFTRYGLEPRALKTPHGYKDELLMIRFL